VTGLNRFECALCMAPWNVIQFYVMQGIHTVPADFVESQVKSVLTDIGADVVMS